MYFEHMILSRKDASITNNEEKLNQMIVCIQRTNEFIAVWVVLPVDKVEYNRVVVGYKIKM